MAVDQFFTPMWLAREMVARVAKSVVDVIADFTVGDGALLAAACELWPEAQVLATDIDRQSIRKLKRRNPSWHVSRCDFLSACSRERAKSLSGQQEKADVIILNPPFTCRGSHTRRCQISGIDVTCSTALAFVATALPFLASDGEMVVLMPQNTLRSEKDRAAWRSIQEEYVVRAGRSTKRGDFAGCFVQSIIVHIIRRKRKLAARQAPQMVGLHLRENSRVHVVRGAVQMHRNEPGARTLVHTTDLICNRVKLNGHVAPETRPSIIGPSVLIPRVGQPTVEKISLFLQRKRVALSDCVIGIQCDSTPAATALLKNMIRQNAQFLRLYSGTCARYTTVARIKGFLHSLGYTVE